MKPAVVAQKRLVEARKIVNRIVKRGSFTTGEVRDARKMLFEAIDALDSYILVPPGVYRKR